MKLYRHPNWTDLAVEINSKPDAKGAYTVRYYNMHSYRVTGQPLFIANDTLKIDNLKEWEVLDV